MNEVETKPEIRTVVLSYANNTWALYKGDKFMTSGDGSDAIEEFVNNLTDIDIFEVDEEWFEKKEGEWPKKFSSVECA